MERDEPTSSESADGDGPRLPARRARRATRKKRVAAARPHTINGRSGERSSLMHVGRRVDYAVRALTYLAGQEQGRVVGRAEIESRQGIPRYFLSKILRALVAAGMLESVAGARGGFRLRGSAKGISIRQVYEVLEGDLCLIDCVRDRGARLLLRLGVHPDRDLARRAAPAARLSRPHLDRRHRRRYRPAPASRLQRLLVRIRPPAPDRAHGLHGYHG